MILFIKSIFMIVKMNANHSILLLVVGKIVINIRYATHTLIIFFKYIKITQIISILAY